MLIYELMIKLCDNIDEKNQGKKTNENEQKYEIDKDNDYDDMSAMLLTRTKSMDKRLILF